MSSIRVRATNKLLTKLGATKPSKNTQFDIAFEGFEHLQSGILNLDTALKGYMASLRGFHAASNVLLRAIEEVSNFKCAEIPSESPEVKQFIDVFKACSINIDINQLTELTKKFETRVQTPAQGWAHQVDQLHKECEAFMETHITYDHYTKKVVGLRDAHNKRSGAGKQEKSKDIDKLMRNEQKLESVTNEYSKASEGTIQHLRDFLRHRDSTLLPLVQRIIEFRLDYSTSLFDATKKMEPLLKITSYDEHLAALESFTTHGHPSEKNPRPTSDDSHISASDIQVNKLSFDAFIGSTNDAPPSASPPKDLWGAFDSPAAPDAIPSESTTFEPFASAPPMAQHRGSGTGNMASNHTNSGHIVNVLDFAGFTPLDIQGAPSPDPIAGQDQGFMEFDLSDIQQSTFTKATTSAAHSSPLQQQSTTNGSTEYNPFVASPPAPSYQSVPSGSLHHSASKDVPFHHLDLLGTK